MKSNIIKVDNHGKGFEKLKTEIGKVAVYEEIGSKETAQLQLLAEEMVSLISSLDGDVKANVWIECRDGKCEITLTTKAVLDKEERYRLISSSTSGKNEITKTFLGRVRDALEEAMASEVDHEYSLIPQDLAADLPQTEEADSGWDGFERKVMKSLADSVRITIRSHRVKMVVRKKYA